jgi:hypothetical protein
MLNVRTGVQTGNFQVANSTPFLQTIADNQIQARKTGIMYNLHRHSPWLVQNNSITGLNSTDEQAIANNTWFGLRILSLGNAMGASQFVDNSVDGSGVTFIPSVGATVWNVKEDSPAFISGGTITNVTRGIQVDNFEGFGSNAGDGSHASITGVNIMPNAGGIGVRLLDSPSSTTHAKVNATVTGVTINGGAEGVKFEESVSGVVGGSITNNIISSAAVGINISKAETSLANPLSISQNTINNSSQDIGGTPTIGILLTNITGSTSPTISDNTITGPFYGYLAYNVNSDPVTTINGGTISEVMQGLAVVNTLGGPLAPSNLAISGTSMIDFEGTSVNPANNFHAGIYTFTANGTTAMNGINLSVDNVNIDGTDKPSQSSGGIYLADFSGGGTNVQAVSVTNSNIINNANRGVDARGKVDLTLTTNTLTNNGHDAFGSGGNDGFSVIAQQGATIEAENNFITLPASSNTKAFGFSLGNGPNNLITATNNSILFNNNNFAGSKSAKANAGLGLIDAPCNWWGEECLGDLQAVIEGNVNYPTWLISGVDNDPGTPGFQPAANTCIYNRPVVTNPTAVEVCSDVVINVVIPSVDNANEMITKFDISRNTLSGVSFESGANLNSPLTNQTNFDLIKVDVYNNITNATQTVEYVVTPYFGDCAGDPYSIVVNIKPEAVGVATPVDQTVCSDVSISEIVLSNSNNLANTTYSWVRDNVLNATGIPDNGSGNITGALNNITTMDQTVIFTITPISDGCAGNTFTSTIVVKPEPLGVATPLNQIVCSDVAITEIVLSNSNTLANTTYAWVRDNVLNVTGIPDNGSGNITGAFNNITTIDQTVIFTITPTTEGCVGNTFTATIVVKPEPVLVAPSSNTLCSGSNIGSIIPQDMDMPLAVQFHISKTVEAGLTVEGPEAFMGSNIVFNANYIVNDVYRNTTTDILDVIYTVTPISAEGCLGNPIEIVLYILPEPNAVPTTTIQVCSGQPYSFDLDSYILNSGINLGQVTYVYDVIKDPNVNVLSPDPAGIGFTSNNGAISNTITNFGTLPITVRYIVTPTSAYGCSGTPFIVDVVINPISSCGPTVPDLQITYFSPQNTTFLNAQTKNIIVQLNEVAGTNTVGTIQFVIAPISGYIYSYDENLSSSPVLLPPFSTSVNNSEWIATPYFGGLLMTSSTIIPANTQKKIAITITATGNINQNFINAIIFPGSGGDNNSGNNSIFSPISTN